jgi:HupE / UreJ protein
MTSFSRRWWMLLLVALVAAATTTRAHNLGESYLYLQIYNDRIDGRFEISLQDLNRGFGFTGTGSEITAANLDDRVGFLEDYYRRHVAIAAGQTPLAIRFTGHRLLDVRGGFVLLPFELDGLDGVPQRLTFDYSVLFDEEAGHRGFLIVEHNWATGTFANEGRISLVFSPGNRRQDFDITSGGRWRGFLAVVRLGTEHIWMGIDHVMFLVALLLPAVLVRRDGRWQEGAAFTPALVNVLKIVTAFTVAHSVTLSLAALGIVHLPSRLVEVVIAASIAIAAADVLVPIFRGRIWVVVFGFGLFHGFGFAGALEEMGVLSEHLGLSLFAFNLGVEIGQLAIVVALFPVLFALRTLVLYRRVALPIAATAMILISGGWVVERALDVRLPRPAAVVTMVKAVF